MRRYTSIRVFILVGFILTVLAINASGVYSQGMAPANKQLYANNQLIVKFSAGVEISKQQNGRLSIDDAQIRDLNKRLNVVSIESLVPEGPTNRSNIKQTAGGTSKDPVLYTFGNNIDIEKTIVVLMRTGYFQFVEPNFTGTGGSPCTVTPNDQYYNYNNRQWALRNKGTLTANSVEGADIDMEKAWAITTGDSSIVVAILDTGIKFDHPEFEGRIWVNKDEIPGNLLDDDSNGYYNDMHGWDFVNNDNDPVDDHGHGTNIAGIIGANGNNGIGYAGVDWQSKLMTCKVLDENNNGFYSAWISGIYYAVNNGADVINMSMGGSSPSVAMKEAVNYARTNGVLVVASMMNTDSDEVFYPAGYEATIAVGATNPDHTRASPFFYSENSGSNYGDHIDIVAPGNFIYGLNFQGNNDYNRMWAGTSQAAPYVTGVISLIKGMDSSLSADSIESILENSALDQVGRPAEDTKGWDKYHGYGVLNAYNALFPLSFHHESAQVCAGGSYTFPDGVVVENINDPVAHTSTLQNVDGCDSVVVTNIQVNPTYSKTEEVYVCSGDSYVFPDGFEQENINEGFTHVSQLQTTLNCDSLITTSIKVNPAYNIEEEVSLCEGESYTFPDGTVMTMIDTEVIHVSNLQTVQQCDSLITTKVEVKPRYSLEDEVFVCSGEAFTFPDGTVLDSITVEMTHVSHFQTVLNCDSLVATTVKIKPEYNITKEVEVCYNSDYTFADGTEQKNITNDTVHTSFLQSTLLCDSIITTHVNIITIDSTVVVDDNTLMCNAEEGTYQWVSCTNNYTPVEEETDRNFTPSTAGNYAVIISKGECQVRSSCFTITPLGVNEPVAEAVKVYPNPTRGTIKVMSGLIEKNMRIEVTDMAGNILGKPKAIMPGTLEFTIDQPSGMYLLNIYSNDGITTFKIVKE